MLQFLDIFIGVIHALLILACLLGWIFPRTRRTHLILMGGVVGCWFLLGLKYGIGYCPLTDWHWQVKEQLGTSYGALPVSFIKHVWDGALPWPIGARAADILTFAAFFTSVAITIYLNFFRRMPRKKEGYRLPNEQ